jgi:hypothetical protein
MKTSAKFRKIAIIIFIILSLFSLPLFSVWKKSKVTEMIKENEQLREKKIKTWNVNMLHRYRLNMLAKRGRIEDIAQKEIGLIYPAHSDILVLKENAGNAEEKGILAMNRN